MSDSSLPPDLEQEFSPTPVQEKQHKTRSKHPAKPPSAPPGPTKDELRCHKALEKQQEKAKRTCHHTQAVQSAAPSVSESTLAYSKGVS